MAHLSPIITDTSGNGLESTEATANACKFWNIFKITIYEKSVVFATFIGHHKNLLRTIFS